MGIPFGRYELLRKIAAGGMGQVLLARKGAEGFEKLVVLKRILPHLVEDEEFFSMFLDEARITMRLDHPNIARINEFGEEDGIHYLEMEYVAGEDVRRLDKRARAAETPLPLGVNLRIFADAASGLDFAHKAKDAKGQPLNLVHRDVSPQNVLVGFDGAVKLIDFGVAKAMGRAQHTATGILKGKFPYMSPEQAEGLELDPRSDVFALAIVQWEVLTGKRLFKGENDLASQRLVKACQVAPPSSVEPSVPKALDAILLKALAKTPEGRFKDAGEYRIALEDFALKSRIPTSAGHVSAFMQALYAERIAKEADPRFLEEDSGLTELELGGKSKPTGAGATVWDKKKAGQSQAGAAPQRGGGKGLWLGLGAVALVGIAVAGFLARGRTVEPVERVPGTEVVKPPPPPEPVVMAFTLTTEPSGAEVEVAGVTYGPTPVEVRLDKAKLPLVARVTHDGYEVAQATLTPASDLIVSLTLKKKAAPPVKPPPGKGPGIKTTR